MLYLKPKVMLLSLMKTVFMLKILLQLYISQNYRIILK
nr:MAG TPA: hypothetical protein [Caudoviricetes sp.]